MDLHHKNVFLIILSFCASCNNVYRFVAVTFSWFSIENSCYCSNFIKN